ncbi:MAG: Helicase associated domain protein [Lachnospiraceae bacterium]|nr:Helicase associated domain protein [Lachnospiraceae bacterium]
MMERTGKAAVIHPTGTGKSFIAFRLCADHPDKPVLWLSPSEYIFKTQMENLKAAAGEVPQNITFCTYAKLMLMDDTRIADICTENSLGASSDPNLPDHAERLVQPNRSDHAERPGQPDRPNHSEQPVQPNLPDHTERRGEPNLLDHAEQSGYPNLPNHAEEASVPKAAPSFIILDEFHRCGARCWGQGVQRLLAAFPDVPILGLSATNIRYLDNQRDMADELFNGNIASEMTLGEAIVRGILNPPKYVLSVYSWKKDLEKYEQRIRQCRSKLVRDECDRYLEALRRTLEMADGLDVVFDKHMSNRTGKYLVFCSSKEHMDEMLEHLDWFAKVDPNPHVYSLYSNDPGADKAFDDFRNDNDDTHLRLLYCIDALNEGIHVEGVSGVILLRPTVSPIVYKQQIGRALSASKGLPSDGNGDTASREVGKDGTTCKAGGESTADKVDREETADKVGGKGTADIFDIVSNIEAIWSIDSVEEEMQLVTSYYRSLGEEELIINDHFRIIDEVHDCRELFNKLNDTLSASWDLMFEQAKAFYEENGNLQVPCRYVTADGYALGNWISNQRRIRKGQLPGTLSEDRIRRLDSIGMAWEAAADIKWERNYAAARRYREKYGDLNVPAKYVDGEGVALGGWLSDLRAWKSAGGRQMCLSADRIQKLNDLGMVWDVLDYYWERNYAAAYNYYREHRNLDVPPGYVTEDGIRLGTWVYRTRALRAGTAKGTAPTEEQVRRLDAIGMAWGNRADDKWEKGFQAAADYLKEHGNLQVPTGYVAENGCKLGVWMQRQRCLYKKGKLSRERVKRLDAISGDWQADAWESRFALVKAWYQEKGTLDIPYGTVVDGVPIGNWLARQRQYLAAGKLSREQAEMLSELPVKEQVSQEEKLQKLWMQMYQDAVLYAEEHGGLKNIPHDYRGKSGGLLYAWVSRQRSAKRKGSLSGEQIRMLEGLGIDWRDAKKASQDICACVSKSKRPCIYV